MDNTKLNTVAEATLTGTAKNSRRGNIRLRSSSVEHAPMTRLPPDENEEIAELWAPTTIQVYKINGFRPVSLRKVLAQAETMQGKQRPMYWKKSS